MTVKIPSRLREARDKVEKGEPVDWNRVSLLSTLDTAIAQEDFLIEASEREESFDEEFERFARDITGVGGDNSQLGSQTVVEGVGPKPKVEG